MGRLLPKRAFGLWESDNVAGRRTNDIGFDYNRRM